jgi:anti-sigma regulatory factor (Ser/Thr protein kinase)
MSVGQPEASSETSRVRVAIRADCDVAVARQQGRALSQRGGLGTAATEAVATAITEIARNIVVHAGAGEVLLEIVRRRGRCGIKVVARDDGPGIVDLEQAMRDGFSTADGLGLGLPGARELMDEFELASDPGKGTTVTMTKWAR